MIRALILCGVVCLFGCTKEKEPMSVKYGVTAGPVIDWTEGPLSIVVQASSKDKNGLACIDTADTSDLSVRGRPVKRVCVKILEDK